MTDRVTPESRSFIMSKVRQKNTAPEMTLRRALHALGYRYRLHRRDLPGSPDLAFPSRRKVIFVHGCFWHGHDCKKGRCPTSSTEFWNDKLDRNIVRDTMAVAALEKLGWLVLIVWECQLQVPDAVERVEAWLERSNSACFRILPEPKSTDT